LTISGYGYRVNSFNGNFGQIFTDQGLTVLHYARSDLNLSKTGSIVNSCSCVTGPTITEGTATAGIGTAAAGLGGYPSITANGTTQNGLYTLALPAPGTTPVHTWHVVKWSSTQSGGTAGLDADSGFRHTITTGTTGAVVTLWGGSSVNGVSTPNTWMCLESSQDNTTSGYIKAGANAAGTGNPGNIAGAGARFFFSGTAAGNYLAGEWLAKITCTGTRANFVIAAAAAKTAAQSFYSGTIT
jgi:hypothetical protein